MLQRILHLPPRVLRPATGYLRQRAALLVLQVCNTANNGVLQGYRRVGISAALVTVQEAMEIAGSVAVLCYHVGGWSGLGGLAIVQLVSAGLVAVVGLLCVAWLRPVGMELGGQEARGGAEGGQEVAEVTVPLLDAECIEGPPGEASSQAAGHWWDFVVDGGNMLIRSMCLQV